MSKRTETKVEAREYCVLTQCSVCQGGRCIPWQRRRGQSLGEEQPENINTYTYIYICIYKNIKE